MLILFCSPVFALSINRTPVWQSNTPDWTSKIKLEDINNDGFPDLVAASFIRGKGYSKDNTASVKVYMNGGGVFEVEPSQVLYMEKNVGSWNVALGDFDSDGDLDLATGNIFDKRDLIFRNNGGVFERHPAWMSEDSSTSHGLEWIDYDRDGDLDLCVSAAYSGIKIYENRNGKISARAVWESFERLDFQDVAWADMDRDGDFDLAAANHNDRPPGGIYIYKSDHGRLPAARSWIPAGVRRFLSSFGISPVITVSWRTEAITVPGRLAWGDIDADGFPELAASNADGPAMIFGNEHGRLRTAPIWQSSDRDNSFDLLFVDVDNDGLVNGAMELTGSDLKRVVYLPHAPVHAIKAVSVNSVKLEKNEYCYSLKNGWVSIGSRELNSTDQIRIEYIYSNDIDLVVAKSTWQGNPGEGKSDKIYLNSNGTINTKPDWETLDGTLSTAVAAGDVDNDGDMDIVFGGEVGWESKTTVPQHIYLYRNLTVQ